MTAAKSHLSINESRENHVIVFCRIQMEVDRIPIKLMRSSHVVEIAVVAVVVGTNGQNSEESSQAAMKNTQRKEK